MGTETKTNKIAMFLEPLNSILLYIFGVNSGGNKEAIPFLVVFASFPGKDDQMGRSFAFTFPSKSALLGAVSFLCLVSLLNLRSVAFSVLYRTKRSVINVHNVPNLIEFQSFLEYNSNTTLLPCLRPNFKGPSKLSNLLLIIY